MLIKLGVYLYGAGVVTIIGFFVSLFLKLFVSWKNAKAPAGFEEDWEIIVSGPKTLKRFYNPGFFIGRLESFIFFISFLHFRGTVGYIIGGWLAFKVASKWETFNNIHKVPDKLPKIDEIEYFKARRSWGNIVFERFIIGTQLNILTGLFASFMAKYLNNTFPIRW